MKMKKRDKETLAALITWLSDETTVKFKRGVTQHGGNLPRKPVMDLIKEEIIDLPTYFFVLEEQHNAVISLLYEAIGEADSDTITYTLIDKALNILTMGNPEGEELFD